LNQSVIGRKAEARVTEDKLPQESAGAGISKGTSALRVARVERTKNLNLPEVYLINYIDINMIDAM
jgi:hypothetical protein